MPKKNHHLIVHANFAKGFRGGERQTQLLIENLSKQGRKQRLLVRKNSELGERCQNIAHLEIIEISKPYALHVSLSKDCQVLHAHETKALQFAYVAYLFISTPYIVTRRVDNPIKKNFINCLMYKNAFQCAALSQAIKEQIIRVSPEAKCSIIPSAFSGFSVNDSIRKEIQKRFEGKFLIGHIGALDNKHKGQSYLIQAMKLLQSKYPDIHLILLGRGEDEEYFKELAIGLDNITFEGFVHNVGDYMACLDLFIFPSINEGLGSTLLDVMDAKVPIIATAVGGIVDIIEDEKNGLLIPSKDTDAIVSSIEKLYQNSEKREAFITQAKEDVKRFSVECMSSSYESLYRELSD